MSLPLPFTLRTTPADRVTIVISVSKKVAKKAVTRNLIRRRLRPIMRELSASLKPATYLVVAKTGSEKVKGAELKNELMRLIRSIRT